VPRRLAFLSLLLLAACASYDPAHAPQCSTCGTTFAERVADLPIPNLAKLDEGVWRGGAPDLDGLRALKAHGFKTLVDLQMGATLKAESEAMGLRVVEIPMRADISCTPPTADQVRQFLDVVTDPANQPVFVHCKKGCDRTGTMCALYRMEVDGWKRDDAIEEMHAFGYHTWYRDFIGYVQDYKPCGSYRRPAPEAARAASPEVAPASAPPSAPAAALVERRG
jgi:protein tyrosine phosphatase (PTP) superfamily phosphohydrolase (DUF442 family)